MKDLIVRSAGSLFDESPIFERLYISGTEYIVDQPEFKQPERVRELITMIEDKFSVARLVEKSGQMSEAMRPSDMDVTISIGSENSTREAEDLTIVSTRIMLETWWGDSGF